MNNKLDDGPRQADPTGTSDSSPGKQDHLVDHTKWQMIPDGDVEEIQLNPLNPGLETSDAAGVVLRSKQNGHARTTGIQQLRGESRGS